MLFSMVMYSFSSATAPIVRVCSSVMPSAHMRYFLVKLYRKFLNADMESWIEIFVPQMTRVELPPRASASEVSGCIFEKVASDCGSPSFTGMPLASTNSLRRRLGVDPKASE